MVNRHDSFKFALNFWSAWIWTVGQNLVNAVIIDEWSSMRQLTISIHRHENLIHWVNIYVCMCECDRRCIVPYFGNFSCKVFFPIPFIVHINNKSTENMNYIVNRCMNWSNEHNFFWIIVTMPIPHCNALIWNWLISMQFNSSSFNCSLLPEKLSLLLFGVVWMIH